MLVHVLGTCLAYITSDCSGTCIALNDGGFHCVLQRPLVPCKGLLESYLLRLRHSTFRIGPTVHCIYSYSRVEIDVTTKCVLLWLRWLLEGCHVTQIAVTGLNPLWRGMKNEV
jgi:hypothetical protein